MREELYTPIQKHPLEPMGATEHTRNMQALYGLFCWRKLMEKLPEFHTQYLFCTNFFWGHTVYRDSIHRENYWEAAILQSFAFCSSTV